MEEVQEKQKRQKSRDYPSVSLRKAVEMTRRLYEKDKFNEVPASIAVRHFGYAGLNGGSRPVLSALRKFGLLDYLGSGEDLKVRLSALSKKVILPVNDGEQGDAIWQALESPEIYKEVLERYPRWELPSPQTFANILEREFRMQHAAVKGFMDDLNDSLSYARAFTPTQPPREKDEERIDDNTERHEEEDSSDKERALAGLMKLPMPGSLAYIMLPDRMDPTEARRVLRWLNRVVTPAVEFAAEGEGEDEPPGV